MEALADLIQRRFSDLGRKHESSFQTLIMTQNLFLESCHRIQQDEPQLENKLTLVLKKILDTITNSCTTAEEGIGELHELIKSHNSHVIRTELQEQIVKLSEQSLKKEIAVQIFTELHKHNTAAEEIIKATQNVLTSSYTNRDIAPLLKKLAAQLTHIEVGRLVESTNMSIDCEKYLESIYNGENEDKNYENDDDYLTVEGNENQDTTSEHNYKTNIRQLVQLREIVSKSSITAWVKVDVWGVEVLNVWAQEANCATSSDRAYDRNYACYLPRATVVGRAIVTVLAIPYPFLLALCHSERVCDSDGASHPPPLPKMVQYVAAHTTRKFKDPNYLTQLHQLTRRPNKRSLAPQES
ncbi:unnamed protein product [Timema podura]|uniref:Vitellogenin n=1 Tax=Timema podura TaxID=61482 RepID=A0ABN7NYK9_TIMPD|nr:unnamed protein product [Timema podura]